MTFSKTPSRTTVPSGATKGKPKAAPTSMHKELQMNRLTVQTLAQMLADQQAATNAQMQTLGGIVADLAATVRAIIPAAVVAPVPQIQQMAQQQQMAAPVQEITGPVQPLGTKAAADAARERNLANLAKGRATAAANRAARKAATSPAPEAAPVVEETAAAPSVKTTALTRTRQNGTVVHLGRVGDAAYIVAWNRTAAAWDWQITTPKGKGKGRTSGDAARAAAFREMNARAAALGAAQVRAGK